MTSRDDVINYIFDIKSVFVICKFLFVCVV